MKHLQSTNGLVISVMLVILSSSVMSLSDDKTPIDLGDEKLDEIGKTFISYLSEELREKLSNKTAKDGPLDMDNFDPSILTDDEKKELESAITKAFEPVFSEFAKLITASGIPEADKETTDVPKDINDKKTDENEADNPEESDSNESIMNDKDEELKTSNVNKEEL